MLGPLVGPSASRGMGAGCRSAQTSRSPLPADEGGGQAPCSPLFSVLVSEEQLGLLGGPGDAV